METNERVDQKSRIAINDKFKSYFGNTATAVMGLDNTNSDEIDSMAKRLDQMISSEFGNMTSYSGKDFTKFINDALRDTDNSGRSTNIDKVINDDANSFSTFFYERYKNINNKYEDLRMVTEGLCELSTAATTLRDNVTASDGVLSNVAKTIVIRGQSTETEKRLRQMIDDLEERYDLEGKLHDQIVLNTLVYGDFFVYHQPYSRIFSKFAQTKKNMPSFLTEAAILDPNAPTAKRGSINDISGDVNIVVEAFNKAIESDSPNTKRLSASDVAAYMRTIYENLQVITDPEAPLLEDSNIMSLSDPNLLKMVAKGKRNNKPSAFAPDYAVAPDNVVDTNDMKADILPEYKDITGVYLKLLSPLRTVPVYVLDECIGYYILYETYGEIRNNMLQNNQLNRTNLVFQQVRNKDAQTSIVDVIAGRIIRKIDNKFISDNPQFRELMVNALMYDDLYRKDFKVQFISAEYMTHFKVNEDIDTHLGTSMLKRSLFYAKLYMTMLMYNVISTVTRANDTRVFYIRNSGIDKDAQKSTQRAARMYKENQISYNDIASVNTLMSKAGKAKDLFVTTGRSGEKPVDIDVISGQDVNMNTDFVEFLRKNMINGTDVPAVILEYNDSADFAKSIDMGHIKYASKICSVQRELNNPCTEFYRAMLKFEHPEVTDAELCSIEFRFNRPKALTVQNDSDMYTNAEQAATFLVKAVSGDNTEKFTDQAKDELFRYFITEVILPGMYDWGAMREKAEDILRGLNQGAKEAELMPKASDANDTD